jgi:hypothetical protein
VTGLYIVLGPFTVMIRVRWGHVCVKCNSSQCCVRLLRGNGNPYVAMTCCTSNIVQLLLASLLASYKWHRGSLSVLFSYCKVFVCYHYYFHLPPPQTLKISKSHCTDIPSHWLHGSWPFKCPNTRLINNNHTTSFAWKFGIIVW